jgi:hypothetical protein
MPAHFACGRDNGAAQIFISAEFLIKEGYTSSEKLAIYRRSADWSCRQRQTGFV